jgi:predicted CopG family antitoxin|tara:strand:+ start:1728 stop:1847 length:120 start_codon:yes stop_codon:yes gene_type:complete
MKQINVYFDDEEYKRLKEIKDKEKLNWHDFILKLIERRL